VSLTLPLFPPSSGARRPSLTGSAQVPCVAPRYAVSNVCVVGGWVVTQNTQQLSRSPSFCGFTRRVFLEQFGHTCERGKDPFCWCWRWSRCAEAVIKASLVCAHTRPGAGSPEAPLRCPSVNAFAPPLGDAPKSAMIISFRDHYLTLTYLLRNHIRRALQVSLHLTKSH